EPQLEWARAGIVESLKARNFVYRWMLGYFFWMSRLSRKAQWGVILGAFVLLQIVSAVEDNYPSLAILMRPLIVAYLVFFVLSWLSMQLFNTLLRLNRFGRMTLSRENKLQSTVVCVLLLPALAAGVVYAAAGQELAGIYAQEIGLGCGFTAIAAGAVFNCQRG